MTVSIVEVPSNKERPGAVGVQILNWNEYNKDGNHKGNYDQTKVRKRVQKKDIL